MHKALKLTVVVILFFMTGFQGIYAQYDKDVFYMRGRQALSDGKYSAAIENFNILARLDTTNYWNYFFRGIAKYNLGDIRGAKNDFDRSVIITEVSQAAVPVNMNLPWRIFSMLWTCVPAT